MTDKSKDIKQIARSLFDNGEFFPAFNTLLGVGVEDFVTYAQKDVKQKKNRANWFRVPQANSVFWNLFILQDDVFQLFFTSPVADQLLYNYFTFSDIVSEEFEKKLSQLFPDVFIRAIRTNMVFLKRDNISSLCQCEFDSSCVTHQKVWRFIHENERFIWNDIQKELKGMSHLTTQQILINCMIWLEEFRFKKNNTEVLKQLGSVYGLFMELVFTQYPLKAKAIVSENEVKSEFEKILITFKSDNQKQNYGLVSGLMSLLLEWINFADTVIHPYCFDLNIQTLQQGEQIFFKSNPEAFNDWIIDGARYNINQLRYVFAALDDVETLELNGYLNITAKSEIDMLLNREKEVFRVSSLKLMSDLGIEYFKINGELIETDKILYPLLNYSYNRKSRYEFGIKRHIEPAKSWIDAYMNFYIESLCIDSAREPFVFMSSADYLALNNKAMHGNCPTEIINLFGYVPRLKFDRFNLDYDVWLKPFFIIGDCLFSPLAFFANNIWFYSLAQNALLMNRHKDETRQMEHFLGSKFNRKSWKVKVISDEESQLIDGDVDVFIEDNQNLLLVQLKRSSFKLDLKQAYFESRLSDQKATEQLNKSVAFFSNNKEVYDIGNKRVTKWIVSTSFENIGKEFQGCKKINYFELLNVLNNPDIISVKELIDFMESDKSIKLFVLNIHNQDLSADEREVFLGIKQSLDIFEPKGYFFSPFTEDVGLTRTRAEQYNAILEKNDKEEYDDALVLLQKFINEYPGNFDGYGTLGNVLANKKLYDAALWAFEKTLELLPADPYHGRNYAIAMMESGRYYDGLVYALGLFEKYPLLGDFDDLFKENFKSISSYGLLNNNQISELEHRWSKLNK